MKIGIVSDSHGQARRLARAVAALAGRGIDAIVHCGDVGTVDCISALAAAGVPAYAVAGNMDVRVDLLEAAARRLGVTFDLDCLLVPLEDGRSLALTHGNRPEAMHRLAADPRVAYLCCGHTHRRLDEPPAGPATPRLINPGSLHHADQFSAAVLDTASDSVEFIDVR